MTNTSANDSTSPKSATATCPGTKIAISGTGALTGTLTDVALQSMRQSASNNWIVSAAELDAQAGNWQITVTAICVNVIP
ncbi:MAG TPA: hypothetical protein VGF25_23645 [Thermoleophilaceae bacterium]